MQKIWATNGTSQHFGRGFYNKEVMANNKMSDKHKQDNNITTHILNK